MIVSDCLIDCKDIPSPSMMMTRREREGGAAAAEIRSVHTTPGLVEGPAPGNAQKRTGNSLRLSMGWFTQRQSKPLLGRDRGEREAKGGAPGL